MFLNGTGMMSFMVIHIIILPTTGIITQGIIQTIGMNHIAIGIITRACLVGIGIMIIIGTHTRETTMITIIMAAVGDPNQINRPIKDHLIGEQIGWWKESLEAMFKLKRQKEFQEREGAQTPGKLYWIERTEQVSDSLKIKMDASFQEKPNRQLMG